MTNEEWHKDHNCNHSHCINGCIDPNPILVQTDTLNNDMSLKKSWILLCRRCFFVNGVFSEMKPCNCDKKE